MANALVPLERIGELVAGSDLRPEDFLRLEAEMDDGRRLPTKIGKVTATVYGMETHIVVEGTTEYTRGKVVGSWLTFMGQTTHRPVSPAVNLGMLGATATLTQRFVFSW